MPAHSETRRLPYTAEQMYDLVADVADYPKFIPWIAASRVRSVTPEGDTEVMLADLVVGFKMFREKFLSRVTLWEGTRRIDTEYIEGPFRHMHSTWVFRDLDDGGLRGGLRRRFRIQEQASAGRGGSVLPRGDATDRARLRGAGKVLYGPTRRRPDRPGPGLRLQTSVSSNRSSAWATLALRTASRPRGPKSTVSV
jgi:coenzyme Q-binding protein COQ10